MYENIYVYMCVSVYGGTLGCACTFVLVWKWLQGSNVNRVLGYGAPYLISFMTELPLSAEVSTDGQKDKGWD